MYRILYEVLGVSTVRLYVVASHPDFRLREGELEEKDD